MSTPSLNEPDRQSEAPSRRAKLEPWERVVQQGRMFRFRFTRQRFLEIAKTLVWVVPLTLLIWVYAENEQINPNYRISDVPVRIQSNDKSRYVEPSNGSTPKVMLTLSGPVDGLERVREQLMGGDQRGVSIDVDGTVGRGNGHPINVANSIQNQNVFKQHGVSVIESQPPEILVNVDNVIETRVKVLPPPEVTNLNKASFDPPEVSVRGPQSVIQNLSAENRLSVYADLRGADLHRPGQQVLAAVPLRLPDPRLTTSGEVVRATLDVRSADVQHTIDSMPIWVDCPTNVLEDYRVIFPNGDSSVANVTVSGPQQAIDAMASSVPHADLEVTSSDYGRGDVTKTLRFRLPDGVKVDSVDPRDQTRVIRVEKRTGGG